MQRGATVDLRGIDIGLASEGRADRIAVSTLGRIRDIRRRRLSKAREKNQDCENRRARPSGRAGDL
jgi:hypothetical protein